MTEPIIIQGKPLAMPKQKMVRRRLSRNCDIACLSEVKKETLKKIQRPFDLLYGKITTP
ncbi:hypothetical protein [Alteromonas sp. 5E99-2]|uniref:hypothetical protein n=1 Tax=Alteromonas sp. 5E99-2 TaxID=2817683 RepID=UPI001F614808|nr:hypothetical protein [Alteromonas sp. 5E99-2]